MKIEISEGAAFDLIESSSSVNNGGGLSDWDHLFYVTDCPHYCESPGEDEPCEHGFLGAMDSALRLGWVENERYSFEEITDKGIDVIVKEHNRIWKQQKERSKNERD